MVIIEDVILAKRKSIYWEVMKMVGTYENILLPMVCDCGEVRYDKRVMLKGWQ